jgi:hypothetical protein
VREARPIYRHPMRTAIPLATLPLIGLLGAILAAWRARRSAVAVGWSAVALFTAFAVAMLGWQIRSGPAAQLLAIPGAVALAWWVLPWFLRHRLMPVRVFGTAAAFLVVSGLVAGLVIRYLPAAKPTTYQQRVNRAGGRCNSWTAMTALDRLPAQTVFTFTDLGPRLIVLTHHRAIAGPYHRNGDAILDVQHAFGRSPDEARAIMRRHGATLLLTCPDMAESTIYRTRNRGGFYDRLARGQVPAWLTPVTLPARSPYKLWAIR